MSALRLNFVAAPAAVLLAVLGPGCGPSLPPAETSGTPPMAEVEADPLLLLAERTEGGVEVQELDAGEMLARAAALAEDGDFLAAAEAYDEVVRRFPGTTAEREALYRKAVCLEWADDWTGALVTFRQRLDLAGDGPLAVEDLPARIHAALLAERLEQWPDAAEGYERLLGEPSLGEGDRRAATVRLAVVRLAQGDVETARPMLEDVIAKSEAARSTEEAVHPAPAAEAQVRLGLLEQERLREVRLDSTNPAVLRREVEQLGDVFQAAFARYAAALRSDSAFWAVEAGHRVGALYLRIHDMFFDAPVPTTLGGDQREAYLSLLRARTRILLANALESWEENLVRAERTGIRSAAVDLTAEGIARVEGILDARAESRTEMDEMAEDFLEAQGESDPLAPLLERLGLEPGGGGEESPPSELPAEGPAPEGPPAESGPAAPPEPAAGGLAPAPDGVPEAPSASPAGG